MGLQRDKGRRSGNARLIVTIMAAAMLGAPPAWAKVGGAVNAPEPAAAVNAPATNRPATNQPATNSPSRTETKPADQTRPATAKPTKTTTIFVHLIVLLTTLLAALVAMAPVVIFINKGWSWRSHMIDASLPAQAKDRYLSLFHHEPSDPDTAQKRFTAYYGRWYGRSRLTIPTMILGLILTVISYLLALYAAQRLFAGTLPVLSNPVTSVAAAALAGGYTIVSFDALRRVMRRDLMPEDLYLLSLRLVVAVPIAYAVSSGVEDPLKPLTAFAVAAFPLQQLAALLQRLMGKQLGQNASPEAASDLTTKLSGIDSVISERIEAIGITTIPQLAYSDPIQLTMRTSLGFTFVLDLVSQALAFVYLDDKLASLRPMGLRGAYELAVLTLEVRDPKTAQHANSTTVVGQAAQQIGLTTEQFNNCLHEIADDPYTQFLMYAYG